MYGRSDRFSFESEPDHYPLSKSSFSMINYSFSFLLSLIEKLRRTKYLHRSVAALSMEKTNDAKE